MKILVISNLYPPDFLGGYELGCSQVVIALREAGHEVLVLCAAPHHEPTLSTDHVRRCLRLVDVYSPYLDNRLGRMRPFVAFESNCLQAFNIFTVAQAVEEFKPDVAYLWNLVGIGGLGIMLGLHHLGVPWVMHLMDNVLGTLCSTQGLLNRQASELQTLMNLACKGEYISCSQTTLDENSHAGYPIHDRTVIIQNWVTSKPVQSREYMPGGRLRMVTAGSLSRSKGLDVSIQACGLLRDAGHTNFTFDIYGIGNDVEFRTMVQSLGLDEHVNFKGLRSQAELDELYATYDLFLFPTWGREPFGFAPMEAMAKGCLAIMSQLCGIAEWFMDKTDCLKVERGPESFRDAIKSVITGEVNLEAISQRGLRTVHQHFHLGNVINKIIVKLDETRVNSRLVKHSAHETYRMALLAEKTVQSLLLENSAA
jgi:glycogen synthase